DRNPLGEAHDVRTACGPQRLRAMQRQRAQASASHGGGGMSPPAMSDARGPGRRRSFNAVSGGGGSLPDAPTSRRTSRAASGAPSNSPSRVNAIQAARVPKRRKPEISGPSTSDSARLKSIPARRTSRPSDVRTKQSSSPETTKNRPLGSNA